MLSRMDQIGPDVWLLASNSAGKRKRIETAKSSVQISVPDWRIAHPTILRNPVQEAQYVCITHWRSRGGEILPMHTLAHGVR